MAVRKIVPGQIKKIHVLKNKLGFDDDTYRAALMSRHNVQSSKALTFVQAAQFINELEQSLNFVNDIESKALPKYRVGQGNKTKHDDLQGRDGMATPRQVRKIEALWTEVSRAGTDEARATALRHFLRRIVGVEDVRFLEIWMVKKVIKALESMIKQREQKEERN